MKKTLLVALLVLSSSLIMSGQQYSVGFKPAIILSWTEYTETPSLMGLNLSKDVTYGFAFTLTNRFNKFLAISAEPGFIAKGYIINWSAHDHDIYRNNYISLPVLIAFSPLRKLSIEAGPELCFLFSSGYKPQGHDSFIKNDPYDLRKFELSLVTGISYSFFNRFDLGFRYGLGLTPAEKGTLLIYDWDGTKPDYKFVQSYFGLFINTRITMRSNN